MRFVKELIRRDAWLKKDVKKVETAIRDIKEITAMEATGEYVLNDTEKKMARQGRKDLHIYTERIRNDTLEILALYDIALNKPRYQEPLRRVFGKALDEVVKVEWFSEEIDAVIAEIADGYGVEIETRGEIELKKTMSLEGEMSLLSILLYIENTYDAKLVFEKGKLYLEPLYKDDPAPGTKKHGDDG
ncbi:MAG: hypothetical protein AAF466_04110 [Bacteroidota bacterium]